MLRSTAFLILAVSCAFPADNVLSPEEKKDGWVLLFDGKSMKGWSDPAKKDVAGTAWKIEDGALASVKGPRIEADLVTAKSYGNFELQFDWRVSPGGNTGLKYRIQKEIFLDKAKSRPV